MRLARQLYVKYEGKKEQSMLPTKREKPQLILTHREKEREGEPASQPAIERRKERKTEREIERERERERESFLPPTRPLCPHPHRDSA